MARVKAPKCPNCRAQLPIAADSTQVTCAYCGTQALLKHTQHVVGGATIIAELLNQAQQKKQGQNPRPVQSAHRAPAVQIARAQPRRGPNLVAILLPFIMSIGIGGFVFFQVNRAQKQANQAAETAQKQANRERVYMRGTVHLSDLDGDGKEDTTTLVNVYEGSKRNYHVQAYSGASHKKLWRSVGLGDKSHSAPIHIADSHVLVGHYRAQVLVLDKKTGKTVSEVALSDVVSRFCAIESDPNKVWLALKDKQNKALDLKTKALSDAAEPPPGCERRRTTCNFTQARHSSSRCEGRVKPNPKPKGYRPVYALSKDGAQVIVATKSPGTSVPMLVGTEGQAEHGGSRHFPEVRLKTTWVRTVPDEWDADDTKGTLEFGDILGDAFFTAYEDGKTWHIIKVSLVDGRTLWDQALPALPNKRDHDVEGLRAGKKFLYVTSGDYLHVINPDGGKLIARYGAQ